ncbi:MAG: histidinol-phosphate transaminase, partial [Alphaproteobacteria bacterium]|nr:histidinol-phosphate transaminase [Alphaproteobacteria bacterium]
APYVGGESRSVVNPTLGRTIRLASNESALGASPRAVAAYRDAADGLQRYPDGGSTELRAALARLHGLDADRIVCGAGSDELIGFLIRSYAGPGDSVVMSAHGFLMYAITAHTCGATVVKAPETDLRADVDALLAAVDETTRLVFLANPNNPTGSYLPMTEIERLHRGLPGDVLLVLDAAYAEYMDAADYEAGTALVDRADNVVMLRTFSKIYGLAALRLGWAYGPAAVVDVMNRVRGPFNVTATAQAAGLAAVEDTGFVEASRAHNAVWLPWTAEALGRIGIPTHPSVANFLLAEFDGLTARDGRPVTAEDARLFLKSRGILVRQMGAYGLPTCLRISIGDAEEMRATVDALDAFMGTETDTAAIEAVAATDGD